MPSLGRFMNWTPPNRGMRLAASALMAKVLPADMGVIGRVVADMDRPGQLASWLLEHREGTATTYRSREERYLLALEACRKATGPAKISNEDLIQLGRDGIGLAAESALMGTWEQCAARWRARKPQEIPCSVNLILTGAQNLEAIEEDVAVLLAEDAYLRRRRSLPPDRFPTLRKDIIRQWVSASGGGQRHLDVVDRLLGRDKDRQLAELAAEGSYATLAPEMVDVARQLAHAVAPGDAVLAYCVFRVLQRMAACTVEGEAIWRATWLRGEKTDSKATPGASARQLPLNDILKTRVFEEELAKGHSGAATNKLKLTITIGACGYQYAAQMLGVTLTSRGKPRQTRG